MSSDYPAGAPATVIPAADAPASAAADVTAPAAAAPAAAAPAEETPGPGREANVAAAVMTTQELDALFASQFAASAAYGAGYPPRGAGYAGSTSVMDESDMDALCRTLDDYPADYDYSAQTYLPAWAPRPPLRQPSYAAPARGYAIEDVYEDTFGSDTDRLAAVYQKVRALEVSVATVDDTTVAIRDAVADLGEDAKALQTQLCEIDEGSRAQNAALTEEVRELRYSIGLMRGQLAALFRHLAKPAGATPTEAPSKEGDPAGRA